MVFLFPRILLPYFGRDLVTWANFSIPSYIELQNGVSVKELEKPIKQLIDQNASDVIKQNLTVHPVATDGLLHAKR